MCRSIADYWINVNNISTTNWITPAKRMNNQWVSLPDSCLHSWFMAFFAGLNCVFFHCRGPGREGEHPAERGVLQKNPQPCQWGGQSDGEPIGEKHTIHHSTHCADVVIECQVEFGQFILRPLKVSGCKAAPGWSWPSSVCSQTLKDYQRKLDTSGLKPSNELYTEYKVRFFVYPSHTHARIAPYRFCRYFHFLIFLVQATSSVSLCFSEHWPDPEEDDLWRPSDLESHQGEGYWYLHTCLSITCWKKWHFG